MRNEFMEFDWKSRQNQDGGWGYRSGERGGASSTEATALVLLARQSAAGGNPGFASAARFLRTQSRPDGGWRPQPNVDESTWVTSLVALLPAQTIGADALGNAIEWLKSQTGQESGWRYRLQQRLAGNKDSFPEAWAWFPGAAAWATPTTMGILAFQKALKRKDDAELRRRTDSAREFLLGRQCADGGWNHGSNRALGRDGDSYPETTGQTLLAFAGAGQTAALKKAMGAAQKHLATCRTAEGVSWLRMGLAAHGVRAIPQATLKSRNNMDAALVQLAELERNPLLA